MTSNIGSQIIQKLTEEGAGVDEMQDAVKETLQTKFLPEFLNRIDDMIVFEPLGRGQIHDIVRLQLNRLERQLAANNIDMEITERAINAIANEGYDPAYGARPLKRVIQRRIQNPLATELLKGRIEEGGRVRIDCVDDHFVFEPVTADQTQIPEVAVR
jgi:ATP-dependent Clp protease ATP-binding subunit ClpB